MAGIQTQKLKDLVRRVMTTRHVEVDCEGCYEQLDQFVEMKLEGKEVSQAMPLVQNHLDRCGGCCEEYEALLEALQALDDDAPS
jgi:hypothetical protein